MVSSPCTVQRIRGPYSNDAAAPESPRTPDRAALRSLAMAGIHGRVFHVNVNCSKLETSVAFYRDRVGLTASVRTAPRHPQPGAAFGLDRVQWDAWIMAAGGGLDEVVVDLLEWKVPGPSRPRDPGGFQRLRVGVHPDSPLAA